ncbi:hypothetical protein [Dermabacter hominis]|uniref:restriction endonuclease subunit S n=1 Tax=Dermabacter hominis TaxID=36740 RepID=UPI00117AB54C|nr:hypothetical protein CYJ49_009670 [Dermabacter hominis]
MTDGCLSLQTGLRNTPFPLCQVGAVFRNVSTKVDPRLYEPLSVGQRGVTRQLEGVALQQGDAEKKLIRPGQIAMNSRSDRRGASGLSEYEGVVSVVYTVLQPDLAHVYPRYAHYLFRSLDFQNEYYRWGTGIVDDLWSTKYERLAQIPVPCPSLETQRRIADYLDEEVREMDALIADLEMLIGNLGDRRGLLITERLQADENDAGGANEVGLWNFAEVNPLTPEFSSLEVGEDLTFLPLENIWPNGRADLSRTLPWDGGQNSYTQFRRGDILVPKVTPTVFHGRTMIADVESLIGLATSEVHVLRAKESALPRWIVYNLLSSKFLQRAQGEIYGVGGLQRISSRFLSGFKVPVTSLERQREIADELDRETAETDFLIKEATELIENLKARKTALITEVVTGRKKV